LPESVSIRRGKAAVVFQQKAEVRQILLAGLGLVVGWWAVR